MIYNLRGIVLTFLKFKETSIIVDIYTDLFGLKSYLVAGVLKSKSSNRALYEPLTLLDLVVYNRPKVRLNRLKESSLHFPYRDIPLNYNKSNLVFFLTEFLKQVLQKSDQDEDLFDFISTSLVALDQLDYYANFHIQFLLKISHYLGLGISHLNDLKIESSLSYNISNSTILKYLQQPYHQPIPIDHSQRTRLLDLLLHFYRFHIDNFKPLKSLNVLKTIYSGN